MQNNSLENQLIFIKVLVNDLGWTKILKGDVDAGVADINEGLNLLNTINYESEIIKQEIILLKAKAMRYLGAVLTIEDSYMEAKLLFEEVRNVCAGIINEINRNRFIAGIFFAEAEMYFMHEYKDARILSDATFDLALNLAENAYKLRKSLPESDDRYIRYYAQCGKFKYFDCKSKILHKVNNDNFIGCQNMFTIGLDEAKKSMRIDEIKKNTYGLACCFLQHRKKRKAKKIIKEFKVTYGDIYLFVTDNVLVEECERLLGE